MCGVGPSGGGESCLLPLRPACTQVIGFDMGGTSTDVSRYAGSYEHVFETTTAGVTIQVRPRWWGCVVVVVVVEADFCNYAVVVVCCGCLFLLGMMETTTSNTHTHTNTHTRVHLPLGAVLPNTPTYTRTAAHRLPSWTSTQWLRAAAADSSSATACSGVCVCVCVCAYACVCACVCVRVCQRACCGWLRVCCSLVVVRT